MDLQRPRPSNDSGAALRAAIETLARHRAFSSEALLAVDPKALEIGQPQEVYHLGLDELQEGRDSLEAARLVAWRSVVGADGKALAIGETIPGPDGTPTFSRLNYGPFVAGLVEAMEAARGLDADDPDVRVIEAPALHVQALWVRRAGDDDAVIPVAPAPEGFEPGRPMPASDFLRRLSEQARMLPRGSEDDAKGG